MKKTLLTTTAAALFILSLTGCAGTAEPVQTTEDRPPTVITENVPEPTEAVESAQVILSAGNTQLAESNADTGDAGSQEKLSAPAESSPIPAPQASQAPEVTPAPRTAPESKTAPAPQATPKPQASQAPQATPVPEETQAPAKGTTIQFNMTTQKGTGDTPSPEPSATPKPEPTPTPTPAPAPPVESTAPAFNINNWISYAQNYAKGAGLNLDSTATACWDNPITAGAHCAYLERDIQSRLNRYAKDESISDVWIWAEPRTDGSYDFYIGYA